MIALIPNLHKLTAICLTLPVSTASVERSFSRMKQIKTILQNAMGEQSLPNFKKVAIESPKNMQIQTLNKLFVFGTQKVEGLLFRQF